MMLKNKWVQSIFSAALSLAFLTSCQDEGPQSVQAPEGQEITLSIIKPNAVENNHVGAVVERIEAAGLEVVAMKMIHLTPEQAGEFYAIHKERPFFKDLVSFMSRSPVVVMALQGENAISRYRTVMGATNPSQAAAGTIRADFAKTVDENAVHGSDAPETAKVEVAFFFTPEEIHLRS